PVAFAMKRTLGNDRADRDEQRRIVERRGPTAPPPGGLRLTRASRVEGRAGQLPLAHDAGDAVRPVRGGRCPATHRFDLHQPKGPLASKCRIFSFSSSLLTACSATTRLRRCVSSSSTWVSRLLRCASPPARNSSRHAESFAAVTPWRRLRVSKSAPRRSSSTTETLRFADHRPVPPRLGEAEASPVALRAPSEAPASPGFCLDIAHSPLSNGLSNHFVRR